MYPPNYSQLGGTTSGSILTEPTQLKLTYRVENPSNKQIPKIKKSLSFIYLQIITSNSSSPNYHLDNPLLLPWRREREAGVLTMSLIWEQEDKRKEEAHPPFLHKEDKKTKNWIFKSLQGQSTTEEIATFQRTINLPLLI